MPDGLVAGIETGGTKILARISDPESGEIFAEGKWETGSANDAVRDLTSFLGQPTGELAAVGKTCSIPRLCRP